MFHDNQEILSINIAAHRSYSPFTMPSQASSSDEDDDLPYPLALPRHDFLSPTFTPRAYLSTLSTRHQTLEDLRADLRERSALLTTELLDLVNGNYEAFLSLGQEMRGGENKVEDIKVGLLGMRRGVGEIRTVIADRKKNVERLLKESSNTKEEIELGRDLIEIWERVAEIEEMLVVKSIGDWVDSEPEEDEDNRNMSKDRQVGKLEELVSDYRMIEILIEGLPGNLPFLKSLDARIMKVRNTLVLDLATALKNARRKVEDDDGSANLLRLMKCFEDMGEAREAIRLLKSFKT